MNKGNYQNLISELPESVKLIAISKTQSKEEILEIYKLGQRDFGENKVQELVAKQESLPKDIHWHMVGHLQRNKVKFIASFVNLIHSVDSLKLLKEINKEGAKLNRIIHCLLQIHIAKEETKFGFSEEEVNSMLKSEDFTSLQYVNIRGIMGMATFTRDEEQVKEEFHYLSELFNLLKNEFFRDKPDFTELSMGMTSDYRIALKEGATMIRIGSLIFGERNYH